LDSPHTDRYKVKAGETVNLHKWDPADTSGFDGDKEDGEKVIDSIMEKLDPLQELLIRSTSKRF